MEAALITGAARRLGQAIARRLSGAGYHVGIHCRSSVADAEELAGRIREAGGRADTFQADLRREDDVSRLVREVRATLGPVRVLVNNASVFRRTPIDEVTPADWETYLRVHLFAPFHLSRALAPDMRSIGGGAIVNLLDISLRAPRKEYLPYVVSKGALEALTRCLAIELAPEIRVNGVAPGAALFPEGFPEDARQRILARIPARKEGGADCIADAVLFLARADYVTGQVVAVDGGRSLTVA